MGMTSRVPWVVAALSMLGGGVVRAEEGAVLERPPMPEPIFTESVTDLDGYEVGEVEFDVNGAELRARHGGARLVQTSVEAEWKVWSRLGLRLEPSFSSTWASLASPPSSRFGLRGAVGWALVHDFEHDFHLQVEAGGRLLEDVPPMFEVQPGESVAPFTADLKAAIRRWGWTVRASAGTEVGQGIVHAPMRLQGALLRNFSEALPVGYYAVEVDSDWGRSTPVVVALNLWADLTSFGAPIRLGVAVPVIVGAGESDLFTGVYLRLVILTDREAEYESPHRG